MGNSSNEGANAGQPPGGERARSHARGPDLAKLLRAPTQPKLIVAVPHTAPPVVDPGYLPTDPPGLPEVRRARCLTPTFGLSERPERRVVRDRAVLVNVEGGMSGSLHSLPTAGFTVGRSLDASLIVDDVGVSREHAKLYWQDGLWWVEDLGSQNGTYVDGRSIQRSALHDGALVRFGPSASYSFQLMDEHHEAAVKQLFEKSHHDPLLGIYNRRYLENRLGMELSFAMRHETTLSLVLFDIDHFKRINDTLGHQAGDEVLKQVARLIGLQLRTEDVFARYGGEEFAILLRDVGSLGAAVVAERVRKQLDASPLRVDGGDVVVTASAGCASFSECDPPTAEQLVALADDRLYQAKRSGRNRVVME